MVETSWKLAVVYKSGAGGRIVTATFNVDAGPGNFCHAYGHAMAEAP